VGESGSGKTTSLHVMRDLYHPQSLKLSVDGVHIPAGFEGIARAIALIPQDPEIFATTILENITLGANYEIDTVLRCTDMACITSVIQSLPKGFHSSIKEKGVNLSGGEQQRLALARGLLACSDKDIILLDEPTSSLDMPNERKIYDAIFAGFPDQTIISSVHKPHLLPLFDRICIFEKGKIVASGTMNKLLKSHLPFREMWQMHCQSKDADVLV
jgi:ABC-type multidrug transport system fused ATPase/permease subunit